MSDLTLPGPGDGRPASSTRRAILATGGLMLAGSACAWLSRRKADPHGVFVARGQSYAGSLEKTIVDGLDAIGIGEGEARGKRVFLKPNLVEPSRTSPFVTTKPELVAAVAAIFLRWGAFVTVGEGPGHVRDTEMILQESGIAGVLDDLGLDYKDLNYEETVWAPNRGGASTLRGFHVPRVVVAADLIISLPKLKTHHWIGMTAAMKNLYGVLPGTVYGWPKNVLHHAGISQSVFDINASIPKTIAIVDAIDCMEGDGPIMGTLKHLGALIIGANAVSTDATCARIMGLDPSRMEYLALAGGRLGPIDGGEIRQLGESIGSVASEFEFLDLPHIRALRAR